MFTSSIDSLHSSHDSCSSVLISRPLAVLRVNLDWGHIHNKLRKEKILLRYVDLSGLFCFFRILLPEKSRENKGSPMGSSGGKRRMPLLVCQYWVEGNCVFIIIDQRIDLRATKEQVNCFSVKPESPLKFFFLLLSVNFSGLLDCFFLRWRSNNECCSRYITNTWLWTSNILYVPFINAWGKAGMNYFGMKMCLITRIDSNLTLNL